MPRFCPNEKNGAGQHHVQETGEAVDVCDCKAMKICHGQIGKSEKSENCAVVAGRSNVAPSRVLLGKEHEGRS
jgi:hypothetical protein